MASFICFFQILENWKVSKIFGKMFFQFSNFWKNDFPNFGK